MAVLRRKRLSEKDIADWALFARQIKALPGKALQPEPAVPEPAPPPIPQPIMPIAVRPMAAVAKRTESLQVGTHPGGLDNSSWNKFRSGKQPAMRTIDLHGRTAQRAYHALHSFLIAAHADHVRCVEVITGRGAGETGGVIKRELPMWLNLPTLRPLVLAATHPHPANPGSVRLLLRRPR
jgi:DNA-nicking Smr family endonuclease